MISGNHEYYGGNIDTTDKKIKGVFELFYDNVHYLQNNFIKFDDVYFYGTTMWTPMADYNPIIRNKIHFSMNDYKRIRVGASYKKLSPRDIQHIHNRNINAYINASSNFRQESKVVLIQHHAPSNMSIPLHFQTSKINDAYYSMYQQNLIEDGKFGKKPDIIIHGHVHSKTHYDFCGISVMCNPRGYQGYENTADDYTFEIEVI